MRVLWPSPPLRSLKLLYRESVTPADYEPEGFERCDDASLSFATKPMQMGVAGPVNAHNALTLQYVSCLGADDDDAEEPQGLTRGA